jgi:hemerythrin
MRRNGLAHSYATWTDDLITGNPAIDDQHKQLIAAVNDLFNAQRDGKGKQEVTRTLNFLLEYTVKHFADEEALQEKYGYPNHAYHKGLHTDFARQAVKMVGEYTASPSDALVAHIITVIGKWVMHHIKSEDKIMGTYVLSRMKKNAGENAAGSPAAP